MTIKKLEWKRIFKFQRNAKVIVDTANNPTWINKWLHLNENNIARKSLKSLCVLDKEIFQFFLLWEWKMPFENHLPKLSPQMVVVSHWSSQIPNRVDLELPIFDRKCSLALYSVGFNIYLFRVYFSRHTQETGLFWRTSSFYQ